MEHAQFSTGVEVMVARCAAYIVPSALNLRGVPDVKQRGFDVRDSQRRSYWDEHAYTTFPPAGGH